MLNTIYTELTALGVPYEFMRWTARVEYPYCVGEYSEITTLSEDGKSEYSFMITAFTRGAWLDLETIKNKIKDHFPVAGGFRKKTNDGAVVITYENAFTVPSDDIELKKMQINLNVKTWKG